MKTSIKLRDFEAGLIIHRNFRKALETRLKELSSDLSPTNKTKGKIQLLKEILCTKK